MRNASEMRAATLLTLHAEYKIHLREIVAARQILIQVLNLDKNNAKARELMQVISKSKIIHNGGNHIANLPLPFLISIFISSYAYIQVFWSKGYYII